MILDHHAAKFKDELGLVKDLAAKSHVDAIAQPRFYKPRTVPFILRANYKVDQELEWLEHASVIEPVQFSDWAAVQFSHWASHSSVTRQPFKLRQRLTCASTNMIYAIICQKCQKMYVGQTSKTVAHRFRQLI